MLSAFAYPRKPENKSSRRRIMGLQWYAIADSVVPQIEQGTTPMTRIHPIDFAAVAFIGGLYLAVCMGILRMFASLVGMPQ
jgi:hypothetical protein